MTDNQSTDSNSKNISASSSTSPKDQSVEQKDISPHKSVPGAKSAFVISPNFNRCQTHEYVEQGVMIPLAETVIIEAGVEIKAGTTILPNTIITGETRIGENCVIGPNSVIDKCIVGDNTAINSSQCFNSEIGNNTSIGPFAHLRPESRIGDNARVGNFVEIKNSNIGNGSKISHLTYIGDADIGNTVNFGCGCVTVNYDGKLKNRTIVCDNAFIGCNTNLVAPVEVGKNAYIAAGSTITENVPENSLAIARERQVNKCDWINKKK